MELDVDVVEAQLNMGSRPINLQGIYRRLFGSSSFFRIDTRLRLDQGKIVWNDPLSGNPQLAEVELVGASCSGEVTGECQVHFAGLHELEVRYRGDSFELLFHDTEVSSLTRVAKWLGVSFNGWESKGGILDGHLMVNLETGHPEMESDLTLKGLAFEHADLEVETKLTEMKLILEERSDLTPSHDLIPSIIGRIELDGEGSIILKEKGVPFWEISGVEGGIAIHPEEGVRLDLMGQGRHLDRTFALELTGDVRLMEDNLTSFDIGLQLKAAEDDIAIARLMARQLGGECNCAQIEFKNFGEDEFSFVRTALIRYSPKWKRVHMHGGTVDATGTAYFDGYRITDLQIDHVSAQDLDFDFDTLGLCVKVEKGTGDFSVNLEAGHVLDTLDAHFSVVEGEVKLLGYHCDPWKFTGIHTELAIVKGVVQESLIRGEFAGLEGEVRLNWTSPEELLNLHFSGNASGMAALFPDMIGNGILNGFSEDTLDLTATMLRLSNGAALQGVFHIDPNGTDMGDTIAFGFDLAQKSPDLWSDSELIGVEIQNGWFDGQDLPTAKYVAPFVFDQNVIALQGVGDFTGFFDHYSLAVEYDVRDLTIEGPKFLMQIHALDPNVESDDDTLLPAAHYFDFVEGKRYGFMPVKEGAYLEKQTGLWFTDIQTLAGFEDDVVVLNDLDTVCNGMYFAGDIDLDFSQMPDQSYNIDIHVQSMAGKISQLQSMIQTVGTSYASKEFELDGDLTLREEGGNLCFHIKEDQTEILMNISGEMTGGVVSSEMITPQFQDLAFKFDYDLNRDFLKVSDIQGMLVSPDQEEFSVGGSHIAMENIASRDVAFDLWLGDKNRDLVRLVGQTAHEEGQIVFQFDRDLTHIGNVHPTTLDLALSDWSEVTAFDMDLSFHLSSFYRDFQAFTRMGFVDLSPAFLRKIHELSTASGALQTKIEYIKDNSELSYLIQGNEVVFGENRFQKCLLNGKKKGKTWIVDQLLLDQLSFAADLMHEDSLWKINFMGAHLGESILLGLEGEYREEQNLFDGKINLLEIDLEKLQEWPQLLTYFEQLQPRGQLRASGDIQLDGEKDWKVDALLNLSLKNWEFQGLLFEDAENISCHLISDKRITFRHIHTSLADEENRKADLQIDKIGYAFGKDEIDMEGLHFDIPCEQLRWVTEQIVYSYPEFSEHRMAEILPKLKSSGNLQGSLDFEMYPPHKALKLTLADGTYHYLDRDHTVQNFVLEFDPFEMKVTSQYKWENSFFWMMVRSATADVSEGDLFVSDLFPAPEVIENHKRRVFSEWRMDPELGLVYKTVKGYCAGLTMDLESDPTDPKTLVGKMAIDASLAETVFSKEMNNWVQNWQVGDGYVMDGHWLWEDRTLQFRGTVEGEDCVLKGYQLDHLIAHLELGPEAIYFSDFTITDRCGEVHTDHIEIEKDPSKHWQMNMPLLTVTNFRPSMLHPPGKITEFPRKPLIIRQLELNDFKGDLSDANSFTGTGSFHFTNRSKKKLQNTIFAIPVEVLTRIGLDLSVLTPVTGTISFDVEDKKMYFTKFKDIYSDKHLSKFLLPNSAYPSYIDFEGNVNVQVKMKQYNLVFKLAELFTVSINGTVSKPSYALQKQHGQDAEVVSRR